MYINIYVCAWKMKAREGEGAGDSHDSPNLSTHFFTKVTTNITDATTNRESD